MKLLLLLLLLLGACTTRTIMLSDNSALVNTAYGELYHHNESSTTFSIASSGVYYNLTLLEVGLTKNVAASNAGFVVQKSGVYALEWHLSFSGGGGKEYEITVIHNNVETPKCEGYRKLGASGDVGNAGGTCIVSLAATDRVMMAVESVSNPAADIEVFTANMNIVRVGP